MLDTTTPTTWADDAPPSTRRCTCCEGRRLTALFAKEGDRYLRCGTCGVVLLEGESDARAAAELYDHLYARFNGFDPLTEARYAERLRHLERYRRLNRLLDVGCGAGHFLEVARKHDWQGEGTEISEQACGLIRQRGITMHRGMLSELRLPADHYDIVVMLELLEHVENPRAYLAEARRLLRPGGALLASTPNFNGLTRRLIGPEWRICGSEHLHYFTRRSLRRLLHTVGFNRVRIACLNWNPYDMLMSRRWGRWRHAPRRDGTTTASGTAREAEQRLRRRIYANPLLRLAKNGMNAALSLAGAGDTLWVTAVRPGTD